MIESSKPLSASNAREAELLVADAIGDIIEFWGFRKVLGRVWAIAFLSAEPMTAATLAEKLQMSSGAISMALNELQEWAVIRRVWIPGDRKEYYQAETDFWKMVSKVINEREKFLIRSVYTRLEQALSIMKQHSSAESKSAQLRVRQLLTFTTIAENVLDLFIASRRADFSKFGNLSNNHRSTNKTYRSS